MEVLKVTPGARRSLRETLRWSTRDSHAALDALFVRVVDPRETALYDAFVRMNHACHAQIEPILEASPLAAVVALDPASSRLAALRRDMDRLALAPLELPPFALQAPSLAQAAGVVYVIEGSRLGATVISRRLEAAARAGEGERSRDYLTDSAEPKAFAVLMDGLAALDWTEDDLNDAAQAAAATFDQFALAARLAGVESALAPRAPANPLASAAEPSGTRA